MASKREESNLNADKVYHEREILSDTHHLHLGSVDTSNTSTTHKSLLDQDEWKFAETGTLAFCSGASLAPMLPQDLLVICQ